MWRRWGTPQNFCLAFIDELEKQIFIKKTVELYWKKNEEKHLEISLLHICVPKSWWYDLEFLRYRVWETEIGNYGSFLPLYRPSQKPQKSEFWKHEKNYKRYHHFTQVYQKSQPYEVWFLRYRVRQAKKKLFWDIFCPFTPLTTQKIKILKKWKKHPEMVYQKSWSGDVCFLRYGVW